GLPASILSASPRLACAIVFSPPLSSVASLVSSVASSVPDDSSPPPHAPRTRTSDSKRSKKSEFLNRIDFPPNHDFLSQLTLPFRLARRKAVLLSTNKQDSLYPLIYRSATNLCLYHAVWQSASFAI